MFNPEKLLGGLLGSTTRGSRTGLGGLVSSGVAMGALGVAMEAFEHFTKKPPAGVPSASGGPPPPPGSSPPPPPSIGQQASTPPPPPGATIESIRASDAVLLIRAMIAAANADGVIDAEERDNIMKKLKIVNLSQQEEAFISQELRSPADLDTIVGAVDTPALAKQVYTVSLMAITVDTDEERRYLETLASRLSLEPEVVSSIHSRIDSE